jgi:hypothetical protein
VRNCSAREARAERVDGGGGGAEGEGEGLSGEMEVDPGLGVGFRLGDEAGVDVAGARRRRRGPAILSCGRLPDGGERGSFGVQVRLLTR